MFYMEGPAAPIAPRTSVDPSSISFVVAPRARPADEPDLELWRCRWAGRILVWRLPTASIWIGPHWYCSFLMIAFIVWAGLSQGQEVRVDSPSFLGRLAVTALTLVAFFRCFLKDPGVLEATASPERHLSIGGPEDLEDRS